MYFYFLKLNLKRILQSGLKNFSRVCLAENCRKIAGKLVPCICCCVLVSPAPPAAVFCICAAVQSWGEKRAGSFTATCPSIL